MEKYELAEQDYIAGMKYKEIAEKYDVTISAVKSWKARKWSKDKKVATKKEKVATKIAEDLSDNDELTDKQKMFCLYYLQSFNATQSYIKAFDANYDTAKTAGPRLLGNVGVKSQITKLKKQLTHSLAIDAQDVVKMYAKQAFADIGDFVQFGHWDELLTDLEDMPVLDVNDDTVTKHHSYVYFKDQDKVDTSLIKSVKMGQDGPVIELYDKQKAMDSLMKYLDSDSNLNAIPIKIVDDIKIKGDEDNG